MAQESGHRMLKAQGIEIIAADSPSAFVEDTPSATLVRQVLGAVAQIDEAITVAKLRLARERIPKRDDKCKGRKSHAEERPEAVALAR
jgi:DNA invertase Pin-like site-specific DNA recombinase